MRYKEDNNNRYRVNFMRATEELMDALTVESFISYLEENAEFEDYTVEYIDGKCVKCRAYDLTEENSKLHKEFLVTEDGRVFYWRTLLDKIELVDTEEEKQEVQEMVVDFSGLCLPQLHRRGRADRPPHRAGGGGRGRHGGNAPHQPHPPSARRAMYGLRGTRVPRYSHQRRAYRRPVLQPRRLHHLAVRSLGHEQPSRVYPPSASGQRSGVQPRVSGKARKILRNAQRHQRLRTKDREKSAAAAALFCVLISAYRCC